VYYSATGLIIGISNLITMILMYDLMNASFKLYVYVSLWFM